MQTCELCVQCERRIGLQIDMKSAHIQSSSYEYDVLTDVISHLIISPMPQVPTMARHRRHTPVDSDPALCALRAAMSPTLRAMWGQQRLLAAMNSCAPRSACMLLQLPQKWTHRLLDQLEWDSRLQS